MSKNVDTPVAAPLSSHAAHVERRNAILTKELEALDKKIAVAERAGNALLARGARCDHLLAKAEANASKVLSELKAHSQEFDQLTSTREVVVALLDAYDVGGDS